MDKEDIKKLAEDPRFIAGIYNYCDRWCERCSLTSRCLNFAMADEQFADPETQDLNNAAFWQKLSETFQVTLDLLKETAEQQGIDLDSLDIEKTAEEEKLNKEVTKSHKCCRAARVYGEMVDDWFDSARDLFEQKGEESNLEALPGIRKSTPVGENTSFEEATQVIRWYQHQIYVKLMRAIRGELEDKQEIPDEFQRDSDGSAKVALIAIDRSIAAWGEIRNLFPLLGNATFDILVHLERLRKEVEKVFPAAREFIRPGFDKIDLNS
ncbi:MAG: hypothetical protein JSV50_04520 [Desulfobacteraceae bacterium]|nr:MAG: hypothetical protein JSV50_04520 [Desulfobacteraceae bacterium]